MTKELFVSSTPHETKVGLVEDDLLAEIYLERENEYTLAGSIYKGRVTRVLPGMQSAFVDIGLERDAFLYVSDFMDLEEHDEDLTDVVPANRPVVQEARPAQPRAEAAAPAPAGEPAPYVIESEPFEEAEAPAEAAPLPSAGDAENGDGPRERGWRGRRRRRGRRGDRNDRGERSERGDRGDRPERGASVESRESRYSRPSAEGQASSRGEEFGPPPGYQPIILPGESISKYQRMTQAFTPAAMRQPRERQVAPAQPEARSTPLSSTFPEDEPLFAANQNEPLHEQHGDELARQEWEREHALREREQMNAMFSEPAEQPAEPAEETKSEPVEERASGHVTEKGRGHPSAGREEAFHCAVVASAEGVHVCLEHADVGVHG